MIGCIPAVELIYRELARPKEPQPTPASKNNVQEAELTRDDVNAILRRERGASLAELQQIITGNNGYRLTNREREQISLDLTIAIAQARQNNGRPDNPNSTFIAQVMGLIETPFGLIERSFIRDLLRSGCQNIAGCKRHFPPACDCWSTQRSILLQAQSIHVAKSPEGWAVAKIYEALEALEMATRPHESVGVL